MLRDKNKKQNKTKQKRGVIGRVPITNSTEQRKVQGYELCRKVTAIMFAATALMTGARCAAIALMTGARCAATAVVSGARCKAKGNKCGLTDHPRVDVKTTMSKHAAVRARARVYS